MCLCFSSYVVAKIQEKLQIAGDVRCFFAVLMMIVM
jgi:hypothetical protein